MPKYRRGSADEIGRHPVLGGEDLGENRDDDQGQGRRWSVNCLSNEDEDHMEDQEEWLSDPAGFKVCLVSVLFRV
ncbi:Protein of unknown function [Pyronema omphalodes CBS 100304]|uniref:Uncharacterized protein n=1 Tax=Pyronema omphalodes (strain CBS 100304) TaxID=1076935 RepID=U4L6B3_PYROM|nr:Protein of unknown function [Pyronema omphalodes CBS 100304]